MYNYIFENYIDRKRRYIYNNYFKNFINLNPSLNNLLRLKEFIKLKGIVINNLSKKYINKKKKINNFFYKKINSLKYKNIYDNTLLYLIKMDNEYYDYSFNLFPITHMYNIFNTFVEESSGRGYYIFENNNDYEIFLKKSLIGYESYYNSLKKNMSEGLKKDITLPKIVVKLIIIQLNNILENESYYNNLINNKKYKKNFNIKLRDFIVPKIIDFKKFLTNEYYKSARDTIGLCNLKNGKKMYEYLLKKYTTFNNVEPKKIHLLGLKEIERIIKEMIEIKNKMKYNNNLKKFYKNILNDENNYFKNRDEVLNYYENMALYLKENILKEYFHDNDMVMCDIEPVPLYKEDTTTTAYYRRPSVDNKRKGIFYINLKYLNDIPKYETKVLSLHENIPGHHYQLSELYNNFYIPKFLKYGGFTAYIEGWGLYCENLENYNYDLEYFGKLNYEILRSCRLVVDTGIHYFNWTFEKSYNFMKKYTFLPDKTIKNEIYRYIALPGQAVSYKIGELTILELKKKYLKKNKDKNIKDFHKKLLNLGPLPLFILKPLF